MKTLAISLILSLTLCSCLTIKKDVFCKNKLIGRGINLGNALDAPKEGQWGVTLEEKYFDLISEAGFNSVKTARRFYGARVTSGWI